MHLKKLGLVAVAATAAMAFSVSSASASVPAPTGANSANYTGVDVTCDGGAPCYFTANAPHLRLTHALLGPIVQCDVTLTGHVNADGSSLIDSATVVSDGSPLAGNCQNIVPNIDNGWEDQICEDTTTSPHTYWDGINISFSLGATTVAGTVYANLGSGTPGISTNTAGVASVVQGSGGFSLNDQGSPFVFDTTFDVASNEDPCAWVF
jgi:hypothetical protein